MAALSYAGDTAKQLHAVPYHYPIASSANAEFTFRLTMGYDYSSIHVFADSARPRKTRDQIIAQIPDFVSGDIVPESDANRSIVVGPPARWIFVGDSCNATVGGNPAAMQRLIGSLSTIAPVVAIHMSDSVCVHLNLWKSGELIDRFGTGNFPFFPFKSVEEAASFRGNEHEWEPYAAVPGGAVKLRAVWDTKHNARGIAKTTAEVLGIHPELAGCGYTVFDEQIEIYFRDWLDDRSLLDRPFEELHFRTAVST